MGKLEDGTKSILDHFKGGINGWFDYAKFGGIAGVVGGFIYGLVTVGNPITAVGYALLAGMGTAVVGGGAGLLAGMVNGSNTPDSVTTQHKSSPPPPGMIREASLSPGATPAVEHIKTAAKGR